MARRKSRWSGMRILAYVVLGGWSLFSVFLVIWVIIASLKTDRALFANPWSIPLSPVFSNYAKAWVGNRLYEYFLSSLLAVGGAVVGLLIVAVPAAYVLSRGAFRGRQVILNFFISGMGIPTPLLFIPLVVLMTKLGLVDSLVGLGLVYVAVSLPFSIYVLQGFFSSLPTELESAAVIDGCSDWQVFWHVMLPLATPGAATVAILNFVALWNEYQLSLVLINSPENRTLGLGLYNLITSMQYSGGNWAGLFAGVAIVMLPTLIIYAFLSERMIAGITMGAIK